MYGGNVSLPSSKVKDSQESQRFSRVVEGCLCKCYVTFEYRSRQLKLNWVSDTLRNTGGKGVDRIVDKQAVGTGAQRRKKKKPDVMPGLKEQLEPQSTIVNRLSTMVNRCAPTRTRTWNPLIKSQLPSVTGPQRTLFSQGRWNECGYLSDSR